MKSKGIKRVIITGSLMLAAIVVFQVNWVYNFFNLNDQQFSQSIKIALLNVAEDIAAFNKSQLPSRNPVKQISSNFYIVELNDIIDPVSLEHYLKEEFEYRNIKIDYEFSIYDCETDEMVYGKYISPRENMKKDNFNFQKFDELTYYFGIRFPGKTLYLLRNTNVWIVSAFVLLGAISFFVFSVFVILRQRRLSQIQKDFINNMAHEFKTPISTIAIAAQVFRNAENYNNLNRMMKYAEAIENQNNKLKKQIENILSTSMLENNKIVLNLEEIEIKDVLKEVVNNLHYKLLERNGKILVNIDENVTNIVADCFHFSNVLCNVIENAIKFSRDNLDIEIKVSKREGSVVIIVKDEGIGIEKKFQRRIFRKFYRIQQSDIHDTKGFGLGLNYVKSIARAHRWKINVESTVNVGTSVIVNIPIKRKR